MTKPTYSGLLERLMTEEEMKAQEKYLAEKSAKVKATWYAQEKEARGGR